MAYPDRAAVRTYMGARANTHTDAVIDEALAAEIDAQAAVCRVDPNNLRDSLRNALMRRVDRNLAMRALPLGVMADEAGTRLGSNDPEVRRLELPFRKLVMG